MLSGHTSGGELVQAFHVAVERAVGEEAQHAGHDNGIVETLQCHDSADRSTRCRPWDRFRNGLPWRPTPRADASRPAWPGRRRSERPPARSPPVRRWCRPSGSASLDRRERAEARSTTPTATTTNDAVTTVAAMLCAYCASAHGFSSSARTSTRCSAPVCADGVTDRMLHERIGADDEVTGEPGAGEQRDGREEVAEPAQLPLAEHQQPQKAGLQEEREESLHRRASDR